MSLLLSFRAKWRYPVAEESGCATGFFDCAPLRSERPGILSRMDTNHIILLFFAIGVIALLYSSIGTFQFWRAGYFSWNLFWPFALLSIPAAYLGGYLQPSASVLKILIGVVLLLSGARLLVRRSDPPQTFPPSQPVAISVGAALGFLAGLTGTGGGIFLTPVLLFCRWTHIRQAAAVSALFIWVNSVAGLVGYFTKVRSIPSLGFVLAAAAIIGGIIGSHLGSRRFAVRVISLCLATVLVIAGIKLIFTR